MQVSAFPSSFLALLFLQIEAVADSSIYDLQGGLKSLTNHHVCSGGHHYLGHWFRSMPIAQQEYNQQETVHFLGFSIADSGGYIDAYSGKFSTFTACIAAGRTTLFVDIST